MTPIVEQLLEMTQTALNTAIELQVAEAASGQLTNAQSDQHVSRDGHQITIQIQDQTNVDYGASHELLHLLLPTRGYPELQFDLLTGEPKLDEQYQTIATALYNAALHVVIRQWQADNGLLTEAVRQQLEQGFEASVPQEADQVANNMVVFHVLALLDQMVLLDGGDEVTTATWQARYPHAVEPAASLYAVLSAKPIADPFSLRRAVVKLFARFNQVLGQLGFANMNLAEYVTLPPVLSARQLRLQLNQTYLIQHSGYYDRRTKKEAYVALGNGDNQTAFVLPLTGKQTTAEAFQALYQQPLGTVLTQFDISATQR